jgi:ubiquinone/menaquinone biosynthesis C-methylase UbiE
MNLGEHLGFLGHLNQFRFKYMMDRNAQEMLLELGIVEGEKVLDFGCGSGTYSIPAAKLVGEKGEVYSIDVNKGTLYKLTRKAEREGLNNIKTLHSSGGNSIPLENGGINHVLMIDVLQKISDRIGLIREVHRILTDDGQVSIYPMHIDADGVITLMSRLEFQFKGRKFQEQILIFRKT